MATATVSSLRREQRKAGAMHELLAPCAFIHDAVLTKRGDLFTVLRLQGIDAECLEPEAIAGICQRFDGTLRNLGPEYRLYQYLIKRDRPELLRPETPDRLAQARMDWLEDRRAQLYSVSLFLVVLRQRPPAC